MSYSVYLKKSAEKELLSLHPVTHDKIIKHLLALEENPLTDNQEPKADSTSFLS